MKRPPNVHTSLVFFSHTSHFATSHMYFFKKQIQTYVTLLKQREIYEEIHTVRTIYPS